MTLKQLIKLENKAKEVWVVSPNLHYDVENKDFSEIVSVNLGQKTKYKYIVPATKEIEKNLKRYKKMYKLTDTDLRNNFLLLPESELNTFILECAIYNANGEVVACAGPSLDNGNDMIKFSTDTAKSMAKQFKQLWKKYKRTSI